MDSFIYIPDYGRMILVSVPMDGNCCFTALRIALHTSYDELTLRSIVAAVMDNDVFYVNLIREDLNDLGVALQTITREELRSRIVMGREWGTGSMLHLLAQFFKIKILVHGKTGNVWITQEFPLAYCAQHKPPFTDASGDHEGKVIHLMARSQHFDALLPA